MKILVADDQRANRVLAQNLLSRAGHEVMLANNGQIAVDLTQNAHFDLILMDVHMPILGGIDAQKRIRAQSTGSPAPLIFALTAHTGRTAREKLLSEGFAAVLVKPFSVAALEKALRTLGDVEKEKPQIAGPQPGPQLGGQSGGQSAPASLSKPARTNPDIQTSCKAPLIDEKILSPLINSLGIEGLRDITKVFWCEIAKIWAQIKSAAQRLNLQDPKALEDLHMAAHALSGAAANIGLFRVHIQAQILEYAKPEDIASLITALRASLRQSKQSLSLRLEFESALTGSFQGHLYSP